jgi:hypothetical protein
MWSPRLDFFAMSMATMFSALESSRLARTVSSWEVESGAEAPISTGESGVSASFRSAVLSVFPFRKEQALCL